MTVMEKNALASFLAAQTQQDWKRAIEDLSPSIHRVDRDATRVWFGFWPLELCDALRKGPEDITRLMDLEGKWILEEQIDSSVSFLYGARFWPTVKRELVGLASSDIPAPESLSALCTSLAGRVAKATGEDESKVTGISAASLMMLRQVGLEAVEAHQDGAAEGPLLAGRADRIVRRRETPSRDGLLGFLKGAARRFVVVWDEAKRTSFRALLAQDLAMAAATEGDHFRALDYRRIDGPLPVECRVGSCGYCWIGVLGGKENLEPIGSFEKQRLAYFGYDSMQADDEHHPPVRLACQAACRGDVTLSIPPWNGELSRRHDSTAKKLGVV